ncbi:hypothetical protein pb186bvf_014121 [Paramecium bursaria]
MQKLIYYLTRKALPNINKKKEKAKISHSYDKIFQDDDYIEIVPQSILIKADLHKLLTVGLNIKITRKPLNLIVVLGSYGVGKSSFIHQMMGYDSLPIQSCGQSIQCFQDQNNCYIEYNCEGDQFILNVLKQMTNNIIYITDGDTPKFDCQCVFYNLRTQFQREQIIEKNNLKLVYSHNVFICDKRTHFMTAGMLYNEPFLWNVIQDEYVNIRKKLFESCNKVLNQMTQLVPYKLNFVIIKNLLTLEQNLDMKQLNIVKTYINDYGGDILKVHQSDKPIQDLQKLNPISQKDRNCQFNVLYQTQDSI